MNDFNNYEYVVKQRVEGGLLVKRILMIIGYVVFVFAALLIGMFSRLLIPLIALTPIAVWMLVFFTWRYVSVEHEYSIVSGVFTLTDVYGRRSRKKLVEVSVKDLVCVAPYNTEDDDCMARGDEKIKRFAPQKTYNGLSGDSSPDAYFALFTNENDEKCIIWFEATEKALKIFRFYNAPATTVAKVRY